MREVNSERTHMVPTFTTNAVIVVNSGMTDGHYSPALRSGVVLAKEKMNEAHSRISSDGCVPNKEEDVAIGMTDYSLEKA